VGGRAAQSGWLPVTSAGGRGLRAWGSAAVDLVRVRPGPGLVHGLARGGTHVALVVGPGPA